jgi:hypothetical protein
MPSMTWGWVGPPHIDPLGPREDLAQIAVQLTAEGLRTKQGRLWHKSTVAYPYCMLLRCVT